MSADKAKTEGFGDSWMFYALGAGVIVLIGRALVLKFLVLRMDHPYLLSCLVLWCVALLVAWISSCIQNRRIDVEYDKGITSKEPNAVYLGTDSRSQGIFLKQKYRTMHTQVIGTTSAGKTESVILPWAINDIESGSGLLIIDGKSDSSFLDKLYAYVCRAGRKKHFRLFSLAHIAESHTFNPLIGGGPAEIVERVFSSFKIENEYYRNVQYKVFLQMIRLIHHRKVAPTFLLVHRLLTDMTLLSSWIQECKDEILKSEIQKFLRLSAKERTESISGLETYVSHFAHGEFSALFNSTTPSIQFDEVLGSGTICYFQLPSMYLPFLAEATGKLVLQSFQNAVSKRHLSRDKEVKFFSCFLDDFQDYIYEGFGALLNKSRSANIGVVFSHQAIGDLEKVSPAFANVVLSNTNIKCVMRTSDPETSEYFSRSFGTEKSEKITERQQKTLWGDNKTGEGSVREVEQYIVHPNEIRGQGTGRGIVTIPHAKGIKVLRMSFKRREDFASEPLPVIEKKIPDLEDVVCKTEQVIATPTNSL